MTSATQLGVTLTLFVVNLTLEEDVSALPNWSAEEVKAQSDVQPHHIIPCVLLLSFIIQSLYISLYDVFPKYPYHSQSSAGRFRLFFFSPPRGWHQTIGKARDCINNNKIRLLGEELTFKEGTAASGPAWKKNREATSSWQLEQTWTMLNDVRTHCQSQHVCWTVQTVEKAEHQPRGASVLLQNKWSLTPTHCTFCVFAWDCSCGEHTGWTKCSQLIATWFLLYERHLGIAQQMAELSCSSLALDKNCDWKFFWFHVKFFPTS